MVKIDIVKVVKVGSLVCTILGTVGGAWAGGKENERNLAELVKKTINK